MARPKNTPAAPADMPEILPAMAEQMTRGQDLATEAQDAAHHLALELSYDGTLTVGALEDEIRFYQRRSVEALLETGKRLLLLKELTPHGEFVQRVEILGFHIKTAQRFMRAAARVAKSATVSLLATEVKNQKAFLELITEDDEVIEKTVAGLDTIDRMSASELRAALRDTKADLQAAGERINAKNKQIDRLEREKQRIARLPRDEALLALQKEATDQMNDALGCIRGNLRQALIALKDDGRDDPDSNAVFCAGLVGQLAHQLALLRDEFDLPDVSNARDLQTIAEMAQWSGPAAAPAAAVEPEAAAH
ncbi:MAG: hypothetical protein EPN34_03160 [Burkholderiaceae bacterium]|nr:MAG: hypothetical protein EPN34_03160 [Burkholderiaceae bacterium]